MKLQFTYGRLPDGFTLRNPAALLATWFGSGLVPFASGTWGTLAALPFAYVIWIIGGWTLLLLATIAVSALGVWASARVTDKLSVKDPGFIVIDEVAGMWLTLLFAPFEIWAWALAFLLFRAADIVKPFPASWADRNVKGGLGVMLDDLFAALWSGVAIWAVSTYLPVQDVLDRIEF